MTMPRALAFASCALVSVLAPPVPPRPRPSSGGSSPGEFVVHEQTVPVRIALIGFGDEVTDEQILGSLPPSYRPVVRYPKFYGLEGRDLGLEHNFQYSVDRKSGRFHQAVLRVPEGHRDAGPPDGLPGRIQLPGQQRPGRGGAGALHRRAHDRALARSRTT